MLDAYVQSSVMNDQMQVTNLFFGLQLVLDLRAEHRQQDAAAQRQAEDLRVDEIFDAFHLPLRQPAGRNLRDDLDDEIAVESERELRSSESEAAVGLTSTSAGRKPPSSRTR